MSDPAADVSLDRALEILEMGEQALEQLLVDGALKGYRKGNGIVFRRQDLADYITSGSGPALQSGPGGAAGGRPSAPPAPVPAPPPPEAPKRKSKRASKRDSKRDSMDSLKKAAMSNGSKKDEGMWSLKKLAVERGLVEKAETSPKAKPGAPPGGPEPPPATGGGADGPLLAENKSLRARLHAAEEVLGDLQNRLERVNELEAQNLALIQQISLSQEQQIQLEAKLGAYEELEPEDQGPRWGGPDPEQQLITLKRETAEVRGEMAAIKHRVDDRDKQIEKLRAEKEELATKLSSAAAEAASAAAAEDAGRVKELETQVEDLKAEREMLVLEAQVARELKGEIDRAAELEEKLQTQREVIEAAQSGLVELEGERDEFASQVRDLEGKLSVAEAEGRKAEGASAEAKETAQKLAETEKRVAQLDARMSLLRDERNSLAQELEKRDMVAAQLRADAERASGLAKDVEGLRKELEEAKSAQATSEGEAAALKVQMTLKDQFIDQLKTEESGLTELAGETSTLREKLAEVEGRSKQAEARMLALRAERDGVIEELAKRDGAMTELRAQAERASSLLGENRALKEDLEMARGVASDAESSLAIVQSEKDKFAGELEERGEHVKELEGRTRELERELEEARLRAAAPAAPEGVRAELATLRDQISSQMDELGHLRTRATKRKRSARDVASGTKKRISARRGGGGRAAITAKPDRLGRYEVGEEQRRSRVGTFYKAEVQPTGGEVSVLVLAPDLARDRNFVDRFWREMRVIAELDEKSLLGIMDVGETAGFHYVAYEQVDGSTLDAVLRSGPKMPVERAVVVGAAVLDALAVVAKNKLVHGDVKSENVILASAGPVKLSGLGLWRGGEEDAWGLAEGGRIVHYGAPEQIMDGRRDTRSDIWSAGAVLYHMLAGRPPIEAGSIAEARALVEAGELPTADAIADAPDAVRGALAKMLVPDPGGRFASPKEAADALRAAGAM